MTPPFLKVTVPHSRFLLVVQHRAQPTPELRVDELPGAFPRKIFVVQLVGLVQTVKVLGEIFSGRKILDVDVRMWRSCAFIIFFSTSHYNWNYIVSVQKQTLFAVASIHMILQ